MAALLDVNALIALVDEDHVRHEAMRRWFRSHAIHGWATCPLTENGMVRVLSQPTYPNGQPSPADVIPILTALKKSFESTHQFWANDVSLCDGTLFKHTFITGSRQVTDAYLLGLAMRHHATVVSFDRSLPWQAIHGGTARLIVTPE